MGDRHGARARLLVPAALVAVTAAALPGGCGDVGEAPPAFPRVPVLTVEDEVRIDGDREGLLQVSWMGVGPDGAVALVLAQDGTVRFFDTDGTALGTVGGRGEEPGEFMRPLRGGWKGDTLWVSDVQLQRVTLIAPERTAVRTVPAAGAARPWARDGLRVPTFPFVFPQGLRPGDTLIAYAQPGGEAPLAHRLQEGLLRLSPEGRIEGVLADVSDHDGSLTVLHDGGVASLAIPFHPRPHWAVSPRGTRIAVLTTRPVGAEGGTLRLRVLDERGGTLVDREIPFGGVPIPAQAADSAIRAAGERAAHPDVRRAVEREGRERMPRAYPPVQALLIDNDERIWIGLRQTEEGLPWLLLDPDGEPAARVVLSPDRTLRAADGGALWVTERDGAGLESVLRLRIAGAVEP